MQFWVITLFSWTAFWLKVVWPSFLEILLFIRFLSCILDIFLWNYIAKKNWVSYSQKFKDWVISKTISWILMWAITIMFWHLWFLQDNFIISLIPLCVIFLFSISELKSVLENIIIIDPEGSNTPILKFISLILWMTYETSLKLAELKFKAKIENFSNSIETENEWK